MSLSRETVQTLVTGEHGDPFAVLGPHAAADRVIVRVFLPGAVEVSVVPLDAGSLSHPLKPLHPAGLWEGTHYRIYDKLGAHAATLEDVAGVIFAVWAPNAKRVSVVGDWNGWDGRSHPLRLHPGNGIWELFLPGVPEGARYKFEIVSRSGAPLALKSDPYAFGFEPAEPRTASAVERIEGYAWGDGAWLAERGRRQALDAPMSVYEVHLGSWRHVPEEGHRSLDYRHAAEQLADYVTEL